MILWIFKPKIGPTDWKNANSLEFWDLSSYRTYFRGVAFPVNKTLVLSCIPRWQHTYKEMPRTLQVILYATFQDEKDASIQIELCAKPPHVTLAFQQFLVPSGSVLFELLMMMMTMILIIQNSHGAFRRTTSALYDTFGGDFDRLSFFFWACIQSHCKSCVLIQLLVRSYY